LDEEQRRQFMEDCQRERQRLFEAQFDSVLANWRTLNLQDDQKRALKQFFCQEIQPPKYPSSYCYYYMVYQLAKLPEEKVRPLFDEAQWKLISKILGQAVRYEQFLISWGQLPATENDESAEEPE
jgi:hypothetical protein